MRKSMTDTPADLQAAGWDLVATVTSALSIQSLSLAWISTRHPDRVDITYEIS